MSSVVNRLRARHREMPHRFPADADSEVLAWRCEACGEWINELDPRTRCTVDWRAPYLEHEAADALQAAEGKLRAISSLHQPSYTYTWKQFGITYLTTVCRCGVEDCPTYSILHLETQR